MFPEISRATALAIQQVRAPVFLAQYDADRGRLIAHVRAGVDAGAIQGSLQREIWARNIDAQVIVRTHNMRRLTHPRSLEHWLMQFGPGVIIYDPTDIVSRARSLVSTAELCRGLSTAHVQGSYFDPARRTLVVLVTGTSAVAQAVYRSIAEIMDEVWRSTTRGIHDAERGTSRFAVHVVTCLPSRTLVPVDSKSASWASKLRTHLRRWLAAAAVALGIGASSLPAHAMLHNSAPPAASASMTTSEVSHADWGVLSGLAVFGDGAPVNELNPFTSMGLKLYFGDGSYAGTVGSIVLAQAKQCTPVTGPDGKTVCVPPMYVGS